MPSVLVSCNVWLVVVYGVLLASRILALHCLRLSRKFAWLLMRGVHVRSCEFLGFGVEMGSDDLFGWVMRGFGCYVVGV